MTLETLHYDVVIVGAGPAGLAAAIRLKQLSPSLTVCVLEKATQLGGHSLSGAILDLRSLQSLLPDQWQNAPLDSPVTRDLMYVLSKKRALSLPIPKLMSNKGHYFISIGKLCQFLGGIAEQLGSEIYPGFAAIDTILDDKNQVLGVMTPERDGVALQILAKQTLFAEGCRGELTQKLIKQLQLNHESQPQTYALGLKEIWQIDPKHHQPGLAMHTMGWPLDHQTYGGGFVYHLADHKLALGLVVGLDYQNPYLSPFEELQRLKTHPLIQPLLTNGERLSYGARALNEGGYQSLPRLTFKGGALIGDAAGFLNAARLKGLHTSIQSGIYAAEACVNEIHNHSSEPFELCDYPQKIKQSWVAKELYKVRNIRPGFRYGLLPGIINAAFELYLSRGLSLWTFKHQPDHQKLKPAKHAKPIPYEKPDGILTFDRHSSVYLSNTFHPEHQPCHLQLHNPALAIEVNHQQYASPETRYCPAGVYEIIEKNAKPTLTINAQNCIHCKTCDIKDPRQNIQWTTPKAGGGPQYLHM